MRGQDSAADREQYVIDRMAEHTRLHHSFGRNGNDVMHRPKAFQRRADSSDHALHDAKQGVPA